MTEFLAVDDGTIAYDVSGSGPLVVLSHGMGDSRAAYRFVVPRLVEAGYRVAAADLRGHGESSADWPAYTRTDIAGDLLALVRHLGGPAVLVGHSVSGGAVTIAAAQAPDWGRASRVEVILANFSYSPQRIHLRAGQPVVLHLVNSASGGHDFTAKEFFASSRILAGSAPGGEIELGGGETRSITLVPAAGVYKAHCSHFLHATMGMTDQIIVR